MPDLFAPITGKFVVRWLSQRQNYTHPTICRSIFSTQSFLYPMLINLIVLWHIVGPCLRFFSINILCIYVCIRYATTIIYILCSATTFSMCARLVDWTKKQNMPLFVTIFLFEFNPTLRLKCHSADVWPHITLHRIFHIIFRIFTWI